MKASDEHTRLFLWSGPRNISTTLMYSFAQRQDTQVYDEPLYGFYLKNTPAKAYHPDSDLIMESMECDGQKVVEWMLGVHPRPVVFFKNMTHHLLDLDRSFLGSGVNILLTRDPRDMLPSFHKVIPNPGIQDVGYAAHLELAAYLRDRNIPFLVLESAQILRDPAGQLRRVCELAEIDFDEQMLSWPRGARPEDGIWARHWYSGIHDSTGFKKYDPNPKPFPRELETLLAECLPLYQELLSMGSLPVDGKPEFRQNDKM